nr:hypothetical protein [Nostoc commune]
MGGAVMSHAGLEDEESSLESWEVRSGVAGDGDDATVSSGG